MRRSLGETRSAIRKKHALISPDSFEITPMPAWPEAEIVYTITPQMGAGFAQYFATMPPGATATGPEPGIERFLFVLEGALELRIAEESNTLAPEGYALIPADCRHEIESTDGSRLLVLERRFIPLDGTEPPPLVIGRVEDKPTAPMGDDGLLQVRRLIPDDPRFDCAVNMMEFRPGGSLAYVETHVVEHGLLMLDGGGIYRLDDDWYPAAQGDSIWMGPYCAQWFGAIGKAGARYLIYKNWHRDPMAG